MMDDPDEILDENFLEGDLEGEFQEVEEDAY